jgi:amino acid transporter
MMAIAALLATTSSTNATLYASGSLTKMLADVGQFPPVFGAQSRLGRHAGLIITAALVLVVANLVDLSAIASVGSAIALAVFVLVGIAGYRRRADTGANTAITIAAIGVTAVVLVFFAVDTLRNDAWTFVAIVLIAVLAVVLDAIWKRRAPMAGPGPESSPIPVPVPR